MLKWLDHIKKNFLIFSRSFNFMCGYQIFHIEVNRSEFCEPHSFTSCCCTSLFITCWIKLCRFIFEDCAPPFITSQIIVQSKLKISKHIFTFCFHSFLPRPYFPSPYTLTLPGFFILGNLIALCFSHKNYVSTWCAMLWFSV